jgi:hypothetical protein
LALRSPEPAEHHRRIAVEDLLARLFAHIRLCERLAGPVDAEFGTVGAAHDARGAVRPPGRRFR